MVVLLVADVAGIGAIPAQIGASIAAARSVLQAGIGIIGLPVSGGPQMVGRLSIVRMVPWTAGPEGIVIPAAASVPTVVTMGMATVALAPVSMLIVVDSVAVIAVTVVMTTPSALPPSADSQSARLYNAPIRIIDADWNRQCLHY